MIPRIPEQGWSEICIRLVTRFPDIEPRLVLTILLDARHLVEYSNSPVGSYVRAEQIAVARLNALDSHTG